MTKEKTVELAFVSPTIGGIKIDEDYAVLDPSFVGVTRNKSGWQKNKLG